MFRLEGGGLQFDHHVALQACVVEEQVDKELVAGHFQPELPPDKGKACPQFQQKAGDMANQTVLNLALVGIVAQTKEVKQVRVFQRLVGERGIRRWQSRHEVGDRSPLPCVQAVFDIQFQCRPRLALLHGLRGIPFAVGGAIQPGQQDHDMKPRQLGSSLLPKLSIRAMLGEESHVLEITAGKTTHIREGVLQVARQPINHFCAPPLCVLPLQNIVANARIKSHQFSIDGKRCPLLRLCDVTLELA